MYVYAVNNTDAEHLESVLTTMKSLGSPKIRVVDCGDYYHAIEGSHRLAAAAALGLPIDLDILRQDCAMIADKGEAK